MYQATMKITVQKASEILLLNLQQDDRKMPPDVKDAVRKALDALAHILTDHNGIMPTSPRHEGVHTDGPTENSGSQP